MAEISDSLWNDGVSASDYDERSEAYRAALFEQYKLCVEMADRVSSRRNLANTFFLTLNSGLVAFLGGWLAPAHLRDAPVLLLLAGLPVLLAICAAWWFTVRSYEQLNQGKWQVIGALEERLPTRAFSAAEWQALREGRDWRVYLRLTVVERWVPIIFAGTYVLGFLALAL
ncbi:RipA family octameric membrane protein [Streptomyces sp. CA-249302]|uniref:RipA family octameric membrane protein n=1 Tax=Streptomyces sp. CA-249302 TaxID=3240058 RepID=UPI003D8F9282